MPSSPLRPATEARRAAAQGDVGRHALPTDLVESATRRLKRVRSLFTEEPLPEGMDRIQLLLSRLR